MDAAMTAFGNLCCGSHEGESFRFPGNKIETTCGNPLIGIQNVSNSTGTDRSSVLPVLIGAAASFVAAVFIVLLIIWRRLEMRQRAVVKTHNSREQCQQPISSVTTV
jgi:hypothetical protein